MNTFKWAMIFVSSFASASSFAYTHKVTPAAGISCGDRVAKLLAGEEGASRDVQPAQPAGTNSGTLVTKKTK